MEISLGSASSSTIDGNVKSVTQTIFTLLRQSLGIVPVDPNEATQDVSHFCNSRNTIERVFQSIQ
jgi:hypothetical protein